ncbi:hypothetical protein QP858_08060 [Trueperella bernardiae]|uniref:Uncharacterized protein n=1 Tax=Trueperella bernardiae TaxID=59561 RepID=A0AAW6ZNH8_9ACTO|nr:hypothetical protein [Micrococcus luteus]MDK8526490.1 hypothetical protein [Micrococcus luteus]MDK8602408.1 hypothetical protein [Trueperella bernardiae]
MATYQIPMICTISTVRTVEADSLQDAIDEAYNDMPSGVMFLNHEYPDEGDWEPDEMEIKDRYPAEAADYYQEA